MLLSVFADSNEGEKDSFDHLRKQPNAMVREESSDRVIENATLDDDSLLPRQNSLQRLPLHTIMLYRQDVVSDNCQLKLSKCQDQYRAGHVDMVTKKTKAKEGRIDLRGTIYLYVFPARALDHM